MYLSNNMNSKTFFPISTELNISIVKLDDTDQLLYLINLNRDDLRQWLPWLDYVNSPKEMEKYIQLSLEKFEKSGAITSCIRQHGRIIGVIGFNQINWINYSTSLGFWLNKEHRRNGIMKRCCNVMLDYAFNELKLNRIEISCDTRNIASIKVAESLNFQLEGKLRQASHVYNRFIDLLLYAKLASD
ncbi:MAG: GNAT family protein [Bdellovibrionota bacterium]